MPLNLTRFGVLYFSAKAEKRSPEGLQPSAVSSHGTRLPGVCLLLLHLGSTDFRFVPTAAGAGRDRPIYQGTEHRAGPCSPNILVRSSAGGAFRLPCSKWLLSRREVPRLINVDVCCALVPSLGHVADLGSSPHESQDCTRGNASAPVLQCTAGFYHCCPTLIPLTARGCGSAWTLPAISSLWVVKFKVAVCEWFQNFIGY